MTAAVRVTDVTVPAPLARHLAEGERLSWSGQPRQGWRLTLADVVLVPFSLLVGGFTVAWVGVVMTSPGPWIVRLLALPFIPLGLFVMAGRYGWDASVRRSTWYGVTDRRVLIVSGRRSQRCTSVAFDALDPLDVHESRRGRSTIRFGAAAVGRGPFVPAWGVGVPGQATRPAFVEITDGRAALDAINTARASGGGRYDADSDSVGAHSSVG